MDLSSNIGYTAKDIFNNFYNGGSHVTFQTCILQDGNSSWVRLFVTAMPVSAIYRREYQALTTQTSRDFIKVGGMLRMLFEDLVFR